MRIQHIVVSVVASCSLLLIASSASIAGPTTADASITFKGSSGSGWSIGSITWSAAAPTPGTGVHRSWETNPDGSKTAYVGVEKVSGNTSDEHTTNCHIGVSHATGSNLILVDRTLFVWGEVLSGHTNGFAESKAKHTTGGGSTSERSGTQSGPGEYHPAVDSIQIVVSLASPVTSYTLGTSGSPNSGDIFLLYAKAKHL